MVNTLRQRGFTVMELTCAFAVVSVLALALVHTGHGQVDSVTRAYHETLALHLAQAELESMRTRRNDLASGDGTFELLLDASPLPGGRGLRSVRCVAPDLFDVEVQVRWLPAGALQEAMVSLTTRIAREERK